MIRDLKKRLKDHKKTHRTLSSKNSTISIENSIDHSAVRIQPKPLNANDLAHSIINDDYVDIPSQKSESCNYSPSNNHNNSSRKSASNCTENELRLK